MVQSYNSAQGGNKFATLTKISTTPDNRVVYEISDESGTGGMLSVPIQQADTFERAYKQIEKNVPKLQAYAENTSQEEMERQQKKARRIVLLSTLTGFLVPAMLVRKKIDKWFLQLPIALAGMIGGLMAGGAISRATTTPPGAKEVEEATKAISKLDVQPVQ